MSTSRYTFAALNDMRLDQASTREVPVRARSKKKKVQIYESRTLDTYWKSEQDALDAIRQANEGLLDWTIDLETEYGSYGDSDREKLVCSGWRDALPEEEEYLRKRDAKRAADAEAQRREQDERLAAELLARRPDLFPTTFVEP